MVGVGFGALGVSTLFVDHTIQAEGDLLRPPIQPTLGSQSESAPLSGLFRAYVVYAMCSFPTLIDAAPNLLNVLMGVPVMRNVTEAFVRATFFGQVRIQSCMTPFGT